MRRITHRLFNKGWLRSSLKKNIFRTCSQEACLSSSLREELTRQIYFLFNLDSRLELETLKRSDKDEQCEPIMSYVKIRGSH